MSDQIIKSSALKHGAWLLGALLATISPLAHALTATASPTTCASVAGIGTVNWTNPARAVSSNNSYATASVDGTISRYLQCTGYNFAIPAGATINGITVNVERRSSSTANGGSRDAAMRLVKAGVIGATDRATATTYTTADVVQAHGGAADLWGAAWTPADINAANFGAAFAATKPNAAGAAQTVSVDHVQIVVDYTPSVIVVSVTASPTTCASVAGIGTVNWTNPARAISSNNSYATASVDGTISRYLQCTGYNFAIPAGATINGITVNVERRSSSTANGGSRDAAMRLVKAGVIGTTDRATATTYTTADVVQAHGGAADLWGAAWTPADINAANFGAAFAATKPNAAGAAQTVSVDHVPITVTYTVSVGPHHIRIVHDGNGLTCTPSVLTVIACANATCALPHYAGAVNGNVTWAGAPGGSVPFSITVGGTTTVNLPVTTVQTVTLGTSAVSPAPLNASDCLNTGGGAACSLPFADSGLMLSVPSHVAETAQILSVSAVRKSNNALNCVPAFSGVTRAINLRCAYASPNSGTLPVRVGGAALNAANNAAAACDGVGRTLNLAFNASGVASAALQYADVGQMTLSGSYSGSVANGDAGLLMNGTGSFIAAPASFAFSGVTAGLIKAGNPFSATVTAQNALGATTPNFGRELAAEGVTLTPTLVSPAGGANPAVGNNLIAGGSFVNGAASVNNLSWGEVGLIKLNAALSSGNYLGSGLNASGASANIGRFIPDHFDTVTSGGMPCPTALTCPTQFNGFVYSAQSLATEIRAKNLAGAATQNYDSALAYSKAVTLSAWNAAGATGAANANPGSGTLTNNSVPASAFSLGVASTSTPVYTLGAVPTVPTDVYIRATESPGGDGVTSLRVAGSVEGGMKVVSGRVKLANVYGSELLPLTVTASLQYWGGAGTGYVTSSTDNVNLVTAAKISRINCQGALLSGAVCSATLGTIGSVTSVPAAPPPYGVFAIKLNAPGAGNAGSEDLIVNAGGWPAYLPSGSGRATFGIYKGSTNLIYQRESY
ncbi:MAG TPA: DUF6701 domain-containing protein [Gallionellaceae bacterium]|nr:DUF6701 domain-containing protein [Gallionellaceae bacterium]